MFFLILLLTMALALLCGNSKKKPLRKLIGITLAGKKGVVLRNNLVLHCVQTSDLGKA